MFAKNKTAVVVLEKNKQKDMSLQHESFGWEYSSIRKSLELKKFIPVINTALEKKKARMSDTWYTE